MENSPKKRNPSQVLELEVEAMQTTRREIAIEHEDAKLSARDKDICRFIMLGIPPGNIADHFGITVSQVNKLQRRPEMQKRQAQLEAQRDAAAIDIGKRLKELVPKAFDVVFDAIDGLASTSGLPVLLTPKDRVDVAFKVLAIDGHSPVQKTQNAHLVGVCDKEMLRRLASRSVEEEACG